MIYMMFAVYYYAFALTGRGTICYAKTYPQGAASLCPGLSAFALTGR